MEFGDSLPRARTCDAVCDCCVLHTPFCCSLNTGGAIIYDGKDPIQPRMDP